MTFRKYLLAATLLTTFFAGAANAQRVIPAGENPALDGTYCNIMANPSTAANITLTSLPCALFTNSLVRVSNGTLAIPWNTPAVSPAGSGANNFPAVFTMSGYSSSLNINASTVVKSSAGRLVTVSVITAGAAGAVHDVTTTGAAAAANQVGVIPAAVGLYNFDWPMSNGIVYILGAGQVVSIKYQ